MELAILDWIQTLRTGWLDAFFTFYTTIGNHGEIWIAMIVIMLTQKKTRKLALFAIMGLLLELVLVEEVIKPLVVRARPFIANPSFELFIKTPSGYSFPSGHTASSFSFATLIYLANLKYKNIILFLAALMAFSRLYVYVHYPTDILGGILLGVAIGWIMYYFYNRTENMKLEELR